MPRLRHAIGRQAGRWSTYGYRWLTVVLRREDWSINGKRVRPLTAEMGFQGKVPARRRLRRAMRRGRRLEVHHSDQGVQYVSTTYTNLLGGRGVAIGMAAVGKPEGNGHAERLMRTIKGSEWAA